jgi:hypothetical protein
MASLILVSTPYISSSQLAFPEDFPYLFVHPTSIIANPGENVTVSICIFNLTENVFKTYGTWQKLGDPYPTYNPDGIHVYPLGFLLGFDINFTWDPNILEYLNHTLTVPVESFNYPIPPMNYSGTLYKPIQTTMEDVNATKGYIRIVISHQGTKMFNGNGTILQITFRVKREGGSELKIANAKLSTNNLVIRQQYPEFQDVNKNIIIFRVGNGFVSTPGSRTRIYSVDINAAVGTRRFKSPIIKGENASVKVTIKNDGNIEDLYNLTVYHKPPGGVLQKIFEQVNASIGGFQSIAEEIIIPAENLDVGIHNFTAVLKVLHFGKIFIESLSKEARVISGEIDVQISWQPETIRADKNVEFIAAIDITETDITVQNVTWEFREEPTAPPHDTRFGSTVTYSFPYAKNWTVTIIVTDSLGITWNLYRPATSNYRREVTIQVLEAVEEVSFPWDLVILAVIIIIIIIVAVIHIRRKRR